VGCSAFVQQALTRVIRACRATEPAPSHKDPDQPVGRMTSRGVYREVASDPGRNSGRFERLAAPQHARLGDVSVKHGHIRIIMCTETAGDSALILKAAESSSATDIPLGQAHQESDIGPRLVKVRYAATERPIHEQTPSRRCLSDDEYQTEVEEQEYVLG
jgi:hypothetical protein